MEIASLDSPVATVDLDAVDRNILQMQGYSDEQGLAFRPHIKTHKLPAVARMQMRAGAVGITCQKLGDAEVMEAAGLRDILLSFPLDDCALRLRATVVSRPTAVTGDPRLRVEDADERPGRGGRLQRPRAHRRVPGSSHLPLSEEHGHVDFSASPTRPEVGEVVTVVPNHACGCANLHDEVVVHRGGRFVGLWSVAARGKLR